MADTSVDIAIRWAEAGGQIPDRAAQQLRTLGGASDAAGVAVGDRLAAAFQRLEQREPTMVLRRTRMAIEELGASAIGMQNPLGRLAVSLGMLAPGGELTMAAIAGVGLLALEVDKLLNVSTELEKSTRKLNDEFAKMGGPNAAGFSRMEDMLNRMAEVEHTLDPDTHVGILTRAGDRGFQDRPEAIAARAQVTSFHLMITREHSEIMKRHADEMKHHADELKRHSEEAAKIRQQQHISDSVPTRPQDRVGADLYRRAALGLAGNIGDATGSSAGTTPLENTVLATMNAPRNRWDPGPSDDVVNKQSDKLAKSIGREVGPLLMMIAGVGRGGASGAVSGLGGIAGTLANMPQFASLASPLGLVSGVLGGLGSIFGGGRPKLSVTLDEVSRQALEQFKELRGDPITTQVTFVGPGDVRATQYALGRFSRRDGVSRLP